MSKTPQNPVGEEASKASVEVTLTQSNVTHHLRWSVNWSRVTDVSMPAKSFHDTLAIVLSKLGAMFERFFQVLLVPSPLLMAIFSFGVILGVMEPQLVAHQT